MAIPWQKWNLPSLAAKEKKEKPEKKESKPKEEKFSLVNTFSSFWMDRTKTKIYSDADEKERETSKFTHNNTDADKQLVGLKRKKRHVETLYPHAIELEALAHQLKPFHATWVTHWATPIRLEDEQPTQLNFFNFTASSVGTEGGYFVIRLPIESFHAPLTARPIRHCGHIVYFTLGGVMGEGAISSAELMSTPQLPPKLTDRPLSSLNALSSLSVATSQVLPHTASLASSQATMHADRTEPSGTKHVLQAPDSAERLMAKGHAMGHVAGEQSGGGSGNLSEFSEKMKRREALRHDSPSPRALHMVKTDSDHDVAGAGDEDEERSESESTQRVREVGYATKPIAGGFLPSATSPLSPSISTSVSRVRHLSRGLSINMLTATTEDGGESGANIVGEEDELDTQTPFTPPHSNSQPVPMSRALNLPSLPPTRVTSSLSSRRLSRGFSRGFSTTLLTATTEDGGESGANIAEDEDEMLLYDVAIPTGHVPRAPRLSVSRHRVIAALPNAMLTCTEDGGESGANIVSDDEIATQLLTTITNTNMPNRSVSILSSPNFAMSRGTSPLNSLSARLSTNILAAAMEDGGESDANIVSSEEELITIHGPGHPALTNRAMSMIRPSLNPRHLSLNLTATTEDGESGANIVTEEEEELRRLAPALSVHLTKIQAPVQAKSPLNSLSSPHIARPLARASSLARDTSANLLTATTEDGGGESGGLLTILDDEGEIDNNVFKIYQASQPAPNAMATIASSSHVPLTRDTPHVHTRPPSATGKPLPAQYQRDSLRTVKSTKMNSNNSNAPTTRPIIPHRKRRSVAGPCIYVPELACDLESHGTFVPAYSTTTSAIPPFPKRPIQVSLDERLMQQQLHRLNVQQTIDGKYYTTDSKTARLFKLMDLKETTENGVETPTCQDAYLRYRNKRHLEEEARRVMQLREFAREMEDPQAECVVEAVPFRQGELEPNATASDGPEKLGDEPIRLQNASSSSSISDTVEDELIRAANAELEKQKKEEDERRRREEENAARRLEELMDRRRRDARDEQVRLAKEEQERRQANAREQHAVALRRLERLSESRAQDPFFNRLFSRSNESFLQQLEMANQPAESESEEQADRTGLSPSSIRPEGPDAALLLLLFVILFNHYNEKKLRGAEALERAEMNGAGDANSDEKGLIAPMVEPLTFSQLATTELASADASMHDGCDSLYRPLQPSPIATCSREASLEPHFSDDTHAEQATTEAASTSPARLSLSLDAQPTEPLRPSESSSIATEEEVIDLVLTSARAIEGEGAVMSSAFIGTATSPAVSDSTFSESFGDLLRTFTSPRIPSRVAGASVFSALSDLPPFIRLAPQPQVGDGTDVVNSSLQENEAENDVKLNELFTYLLATETVTK